jgi:hypothetical protein
MYSSALSLPSTLDGGGWSAPHPGRFTPGKETRYPMYRRLGWPEGQSGRVRKISPPPGFEPRTIEPRSESLYRLSCPGPQFHAYSFEVSVTCLWAGDKLDWRCSEMFPCAFPTCWTISCGYLLRWVVRNTSYWWVLTCLLVILPCLSQL